MKPLLIVWAAIGMTIVALLFPPQGYTREIVWFAYRDSGPSGREIDSVESDVPWTYQRHKFLFSAHDTSTTEEKSYNKTLYLMRARGPVNPRTAWSLVAVELIIIALVAGGLLWTVARKPS